MRGQDDIVYAGQQIVVAHRFGLQHGEASQDSWYAPDALAPLDAAIVANQGAFSAAIRRSAVIEIGR